MGWLEAIVGGLVPPRCAACGRLCTAGELTCAACAQRLATMGPVAGSGPPGVDRAWASAAYDGVARDLVAALKFRRLLGVADLMAARIHWLAPAELLSGTVVPVPAAPLRAMSRGFDPAGELAGALAGRLGAPLEACLGRAGGRRQVGKRRGERIGNPPLVEAKREAPPSAILVDDVLTTGATLSACARALREAGAIRVVAITFARRP